MRVCKECGTNVLVCLCLAFVAGVAVGGWSNSAPSQGPDCLTAQDLNRSDIGTAIVLSRFCEGLGLQSSVYWQRDLNGNVYALPVCVQRSVTE